MNLTPFGNKLSDNFVKSTFVKDFDYEVWFIVKRMWKDDEIRKLDQNTLIAF